LTICSAELLQYFLSLPPGKYVQSDFKRSQNNPFTTKHKRLQSGHSSSWTRAQNHCPKQAKKWLCNTKKTLKFKPTNQQLLSHEDEEPSTAMQHPELRSICQPSLCYAPTPATSQLSKLQHGQTALGQVSHTAPQISPPKELPSHHKLLLFIAHSILCWSYFTGWDFRARGSPAQRLLFRAGAWNGVWGAGVIGRRGGGRAGQVNSAPEHQVPHVADGVQHLSGRNRRRSECRAAFRPDRGASLFGFAAGRLCYISR